MKVPSPRRIKAWLVAAVSLVALTVVSIAPITRPRAQSPPTTYTITDLGTLGGTQTKAFGINNCGLVVGQSAPSGTAPVHPFFWRDLDGDGVSDPGEMKDIGMLGSASNGTTTAVNNFGYVVGNSPTGASNDRAFIWHDDNGDGDSDAGEMKDLLVGFQGSASAEDINDNGKVVGWVLADSGDILGYQMFVWENNSFQFLNRSIDHSPLAHGINNAGTIVGEDSNFLRGWILRGGVNGVFTDIGVFAPSNVGRSVAYAVSEADHVVGTAEFSPGTHAFIWTDPGGVGQLKDLGTLSPLTNSVAYDVAIVNPSVQVVGTSYIGAEPTGPSARAFVWQDANGDGDGAGEPLEMKDLTTASVDPTGAVWVLQQARSINSSGQIVGYGIKNGTETRAFLLTPTGVTPSPCLPTVNVSVSPSAVNEDGADSLTYTFTRSIVTASPLTVSFSTTGTAVANDYAISAVSTVQIPANMASATVTVTPIADTTDEPNETVILSITPDAANYSVGAQNPATGTITDDDAAPTIQITNVTSAEANSGLTAFVFTVSLTNPSSSQIAVDYATDTTGATATAGASCSAGVDFVSIPSTGLTFLAGETSKQVSVTVCGDNDVEPDETFFVNLSGNTNSSLPANTKGTGTITNDDSVSSVSVSVAPLTAGEDGTTNLVYTFTRSTTTGSPLIVSFATTGTAVADDYAISSVSNVQIPANMASVAVTVTPIADTTDEPDETVILTVTPDAAYTVAAAPQNAAQGTITDDDPTPTIQITNVTAAEPTSGSMDFVFTVSLTNPSSSQIAVNVATATTGATTPATGGAGCTAGIDFVDTGGTLTFSAGETSKPVSVTVCGDNSLEPDETFFVNLSGNSANSLLPTNTKGTGTITPQAPVVYVEAGTESNPIPKAAAVDSVTFARGPFRLTNDLNFSSDRLTRVILVTSNLGMTQGDLATGILTVHVAGYANPLPIEHVGTISGVVGLNASFIIVRLPADLQPLNPLPGPNNLTLTVKMGSATSNATLLSITP